MFSNARLHHILTLSKIISKMLQFFCFFVIFETSLILMWDLKNLSKSSQILVCCCFRPNKCFQTPSYVAFRSYISLDLKNCKIFDFFVNFGTFWPQCGTWRPSSNRLKFEYVVHIIQQNHSRPQATLNFEFQKNRKNRFLGLPKNFQDQCGTSKYQPKSMKFGVAS